MCSATPQQQQPLYIYDHPNLNNVFCIAIMNKNKWVQKNKNKNKKLTYSCEFPVLGGSNPTVSGHKIFPELRPPP